MKTSLISKRSWSLRATRTLMGVALSVVVAAPALASHPAPEPASAGFQGVRIRKDVQDLSPAERRQFVDAVKELKRRCSPFASGQAYESPYRHDSCAAPDGSMSSTGISWYDQFVLWHRELSRCNPASTHNMNGHNGPLFLPWHREFLMLFEDALREVSGHPVTVPYWDTSDQASTDAVFAADFMGGNGDPDHGWALMEGPFAATEWNDFPVRNEGAFWGPSSTGHIVRRMGSLGGPPEPKKAPTPSESIAAAMAASHYDAAPYNDSSDHTISFRNALEGWVGDRTKLPPRSVPNPIDVGPSRAYCAPDGWSVVPMRRNMTHNLAHSYVGGVLGATPEGVVVFGTMTAVPTSPNDPTFFLLHSNVDRLWAEWQEIPRDEPSAALFPQDSANEWDDPNAPMKPFVGDGVEVAPVAVQSIEELGYRYDHRAGTGGSEGIEGHGQGDDASARKPAFCTMPSMRNSVHPPTEAI